MAVEKTEKERQFRLVWRVLAHHTRRASRRHFRGVVKNPHHYGTAVLMSVVLVVTGHVAEAGVAWLYAVCEAFVSGAE